MTLSPAKGPDREAGLRRTVRPRLWGVKLNGFGKVRGRHDPAPVGGKKCDRALRRKQKNAETQSEKGSQNPRREETLSVKTPPKSRVTLFLRAGGGGSVCSKDSIH